MIEFTVAPRSSVLIATVSGRLTAADCREYVARTYRGSPFLPVMNVLIDLRGLHEAPSQDVIDEIVGMLARVEEVPIGSRRAVLAGDGDCLRSAAAIIDALPQAVGRAVFRNPEAALEWLLEQEHEVARQRARRSAA